MYTHYNEPLFDYIIIRESDELVNGVAAKQVAEADSYSVQYIPNGLDNEIKNRGIQNQLYGLILVPNIVNNSIFTIYLYCSAQQY